MVKLFSILLFSDVNHGTIIKPRLLPPLLSTDITSQNEILKTAKTALDNKDVPSRFVSPMEKIFIATSGFVPKTTLYKITVKIRV